MALVRQITLMVLRCIQETPVSARLTFPHKGDIEGQCDAATALRIIEDARALEGAGICLLLLEAVPPEVGKIITERAKIPVCGIGAGPDVDGQCLIVHDMLGMFEAFTPKFVKKYANIGEQIVNALMGFREDVNKKAFPGPEHCYGMPEEEMGKLRGLLT